jgi:hypothetical protein
MIDLLWPIAAFVVAVVIVFKIAGWLNARQKRDEREKD